LKQPSGEHAYAARRSGGDQVASVYRGRFETGDYFAAQVAK
jgi:hypothetical protein